MPQKINYYSVLSRAVAAFDRDAYGARGAVYDREHRLLLRRLALADPPCSQQEMAEEEEAFRDAIRRIEFPEFSGRAAPTARSEPVAPRGEPTESRREPVEPRRGPPEVRREAVEPRREAIEPRREPVVEPRREPVVESRREPVVESRREPIAARREGVESRRDPVEQRREPIEPRREPVEARREAIEPRREPFVEPRREPAVESRREPVEPRREPIESRREPVEARREPVRESPPERPGSRRELQREPAADPEPPSPREARWRRSTADEEPGGEPPVPPVEPAPRASLPVEPEPGVEEPKPRSVFRRILFYARIILLVLGAGALAYAWTTSDIDLSWLTASSPSAASPQRAVLYEAGAGDRKADPVVGKATWRTRTQASGSGKPDTVVILEAEIPERQLAMTMTIARETETGGGMSHTFEISFAHPTQLPFGGIAGVSKIVMKGAEADLGDDLIGTSIAIGPGNYLFGLLGTPDAIQRNVELLRTRPWLGVLIVFTNGQVQMLNAEKGASGQRAIDDAIAKWTQ